MNNKLDQVPEEFKQLADEISETIIAITDRCNAVLACRVSPK